MDYFEKFVNVLHGNFHDDFNSLMDATTRFDSFHGIPLSIKEVDNRPPQPTVYAKPVEPKPEVKTTKVDVDFEVIDLDAEMEKRKQSTAGNQVIVDTIIEPEERLTITLKKRVTKKSPRGSVIQTHTGEGITTEVKIYGNRAQRKAAEAINRKAKKNNNKSPRSNSNKNNSGSQKENSPRRIDLSDLAFGFKME